MFSNTHSLIVAGWYGLRASIQLLGRGTQPTNCVVLDVLLDRPINDRDRDHSVINGSGSLGMLWPITRDRGLNLLVGHNDRVR